MNEDDATILHDKPVLASGRQVGNDTARTASSPAAAPKIGVINAEDRSRFTSETEQLLRGRLKAAAIDLGVVLGLGLIGNCWVGNFNWLGLRLLIFSSVIVSYVLLKRIPNLPMASLRWIEATLLGGVAVQMSLMMYSRISGLAAANDGVSMISAADFFVAAFCLHILTYGIFLPNSWKRAAVIMSIFAGFANLDSWWIRIKSR